MSNFFKNVKVGTSARPHGGTSTMGSCPMVTRPSHHGIGLAVFTVEGYMYISKDAALCMAPSL